MDKQYWNDGSQKAVCSDCDSAGVELMFFKNLPNKQDRREKSKPGEIRKEGRRIKEMKQKESPCLEMLDTDNKNHINPFLGL